MRVLRTYEEVVQLSMCEDFVPAFHFVFGWPHQANPKVRSITKMGYLAPAGEVGRTGLFIFDVLAGDDANVFLAAVKRPIGIADPICYGYVFDAERLVRLGAAVGTGDLLTEYQKAFTVVASRYMWPGDADSASIRGRARFTPEDMEEFLDFQGRGPEGYVRVRDFIADTLPAFQQVQAQHRVRGPAALDALDKFADYACKETRRLLALAAERMQTEKFERAMAHYQADIFGWSLPKACRVAARDTVAGEEGYTQLSIMSTPEIIWPGRLPLDLAIYGFRLPCYVGQYGLEGSLHWPDDLFRLLCPRSGPD